MPFKSKAQQGYMHALAAKGELPKSINLPEWDAATKGRKLPSVADPMKQALANKRQEHAEGLGIAPKMKAIAQKVKNLSPAKPIVKVRKKI